MSIKEKLYSTKIETDEENLSRDVFLRIKRKLKKIWITISTILTILLVVFLVVFFVRKTYYQITNVAVKKLLEETPIQLVTNTMLTNVICTVEDVPAFATAKIKNMILGESTGIFMTKVKYVFGLDLQKELTEDDVVVDETSITITLPEPKILYSEIDINYKVITKTPVWRSLVDSITGVDFEKEVRKIFGEKANDFAVENEMIPSKLEIINRIEPFFNKIIGAQTNKKIIFK